MKIVGSAVSNTFHQYLDPQYLLGVEDIRSYERALTEWEIRHSHKKNVPKWSERSVTKWRINNLRAVARLEKKCAMEKIICSQKCVTV